MLIAAAFWLATRPGLSLRRPDFRDLGSARQAPNDTTAASPISPDMNLADAGRDLRNGDPDAHDWTVYEQPEKIKTDKFHIVLKDETLSDISHQHYGSAVKWQKIYNANRDIIKNPNRVRPGTKLIIPD